MSIVWLLNDHTEVVPPKIRFIQICAAGMSGNGDKKGRHNKAYKESISPGMKLTSRSTNFMEAITSLTVHMMKLNMLMSIFVFVMDLTFDS